MLGCALLTSPPCDPDDDGEDDVTPADAAPEPPADAVTTRCLQTGGLLTERACCQTASALPSTCASGTCDCPPEDAKVVPYCECGSLCIDPQLGCIDQGR